ncbi:MAG: hypothetical protein LBB88_00655 [Planctomycetaceae bacterium]|jgi:hypothetical protein|nr:hypothetical protein [Planctomycetaceae bacterium]
MVNFDKNISKIKRNLTPTEWIILAIIAVVCSVVLIFYITRPVNKTHNELDSLGNQKFKVENQLDDIKDQNTKVDTLPENQLDEIKDQNTKVDDLPENQLDEIINQNTNADDSITKTTQLENEPNLRLWNTSNDQYDKLDKPPDNFDAKRRCIVIVHGMGGDVDIEDYKVFARRIKKFEPKTNILVVDWLDVQKNDIRKTYQKMEDGIITAADLIDPKNIDQDESEEYKKWFELKKLGATIADKTDILKKPLTPFLSASVIPKVAEWASDKLFDDIKGLGIKPENTYIIGFSHGSHVAGLIGENTLKKYNRKIGRVTLLDPSTGKVHLTPKNFIGKGWDKKSVLFVDMYKTSKWAGSGLVRGNKTFFVRQKNLPMTEFLLIREVTPDHFYAFRWFISTIGSNEKSFGYSMDIPSKENYDEHWSGFIVSSLRRDCKLDDIEKNIDNQLLPLQSENIDSSRELFNKIKKLKIE